MSEQFHSRFHNERTRQAVQDNTGSLTTAQMLAAVEAQPGDIIAVESAGVVWRCRVLESQARRAFGALVLGGG